ncbi:MAG TPA: hypothetical protein VGL71_02600, partial [Urbifossiella sp.]
MKLPPPPRRRRLHVERLEDRTVPTIITVTTLDDIVDGDTTNSADLMASPGADNSISLREAIEAATNDGTADTIQFDPSLSQGTIDLMTADNGDFGPTSFEISTPITIEGSGQILNVPEGPGDFRIFAVTSAGSLTLDNLELTGGIAEGGD